MFMNLGDNCTPVIQRNVKKKGQNPKSKTLKDKTTTEVNQVQFSIAICIPLKSKSTNMLRA